MTLPHEKRFPIAFEMASSQHAEGRPALAPTAALTAANETIGAIARVALRYGWPVTGDSGRWVVDAGDGRRVLTEKTDEASGTLLRFRRLLAPEPLTPPQEVELLRKNARTAHAGFSVGTDGRGLLVATLPGETPDDNEVDAVLRSMIAGGEGVGTRPLGAFDPSNYKTSSEPGEWEKKILFESLGRAKIAFELTGPHATATIALEGGRHRGVHLLFDRADAWGDQVIQMISYCAPADPAWHHKALAANASLTFAVLALAAFGQSEGFVAVRTQLARTVDPDGLLSSVKALAQVADRVELDLSDGKDDR